MKHLFHLKRKQILSNIESGSLQLIILFFSLLCNVFKKEQNFSKIIEKTINVDGTVVVNLGKHHMFSP